MRRLLKLIAVKSVEEMRNQVEFLSALDIALGESNETENWPYKIRDTNFLDIETVNARIEQIKVISRMLTALIHGIENKPNLSRSNRYPSTVLFRQP